MTLTGLTGLGGGQSVTSAASKVDQAIESFSITTTGFVQTFTKARSDGGYDKLYVWTDPGTFEVTQGSRDIDVFVLGGGGAGAPGTPPNSNIIDNGTINTKPAEVWKVGGGGGGGGYDQVINYTVSEPAGSTEKYVVTVGGGGIWGLKGGPTGNSQGGGGFSRVYLEVDGNEPTQSVVLALGGEGGSGSPLINSPDNTGDGGSGTAIVNGSPSPVPPGRGEEGNVIIRVYPSTFVVPTDYFVGPRSIPSTELNEAVHGYVTGYAGGAAGRKTPTGTLIPGSALQTAPRPDFFPTNGGDPDKYQFEGTSDGADGFEVDATVFGGIDFPGGYGPGRWAAGGGGGINRRPSSKGGFSPGGQPGTGGRGGGGHGGAVGRDEVEDGQNATSYGSGGGGGSVLRAKNWPAPVIDQFSVGSDGGSGFKGICVMRHIKSLY